MAQQQVTLAVTLTFPEDISDENREWFTDMTARVIRETHGSKSRGITVDVSVQP